MTNKNKIFGLKKWGQIIKMSQIPSVQKLMQSLGAIIITKDMANKIMPFSNIGNFFHWQDERLKIAEERIKVLEQRLFDLEYKQKNSIKKK